MSLSESHKKQGHVNPWAKFVFAFFGILIGCSVLMNWENIPSYRKIFGIIIFAIGISLLFLGKCGGYSLSSISTALLVIGGAFSVVALFVLVTGYTPKFYKRVSRDSAVQPLLYSLGFVGIGLVLKIIHLLHKNHKGN